MCTGGGGGGHTVTGTTVISLGQVAVSPTGPEAGDVYTISLAETATTGGTVSVYNPATHGVVATIAVGTNPSGVAVSPTGPEAGYIYVPNQGVAGASTPGTVSVINPATNMVVATITVGKAPDAVAVSPTGPQAGFIYVGSVGSTGYEVSVINPATNMVVDNITFPFTSGAFVANTDVITVSPTGPFAGDVVLGGQITTGGTPANPTAINQVVVVNPVTDATVSTFTLPGNPLTGTFALGVEVSPTGPAAGDIYATTGSGAINTAGTLSVINPTTNTINNVDLPSVGTGFGVGVSPTGPAAGDIYIGQDNGTVLVFNPAGTIVDNITTGGAPFFPTVSPTGSFAGDIYVSNGFLQVIS
jgi:YVTN family beta-propeller protein